MPGFCVIALKDLRVLLRDPVALFWVVAFPVFFAVFFGSVMRAGVNADTAALQVVVVDVPGSERARRLRTGLAAAGVRARMASAEEARRAVLHGEAAAFVRPAAAALGRVEIGIDPVRRGEGALLEGLVRSALLPEYARPDAGALSVETQALGRAGGEPQSGFEIVFPAMLLWGLMGCAATFAVAIASERTSGTLQRLRAAPISRASILAGKATACFAACVGDALLLSALAWLVLDVRIERGVLCGGAVLAAALCFSGLTMVLSVLGKTDQAVAGTGWSALIVLAMLGGAMVPLSVMPQWLLDLSELSPVKWGISALQGAMWRGHAFSELWPLLARLSALGVAGFVAGSLVLARAET